MTIFGSTEATNRTKFAQGLQNEDSQACQPAAATAVLGSIKAPNLKLSGACDANINLGTIEMKSALTCNSDSVLKYVTKQAMKQAAEAKGTGFQLGDIKSTNETDFTNQMNSHIEKKCGGLRGVVSIADIDMSGQTLTCEDHAKLNLNAGVIGFDSFTDCAFKAASDLASDTKVDNTAKATQDLSGLFMFILLGILLLMSPVILPMMSLGSIAKHPLGLLGLALTIAWFVVKFDCWAWSPLGKHFCKSKSDRVKHENRLYWTTLTYAIVVVLFVIYKIRQLSKGKNKIPNPARKIDWAYNPNNPVEVD